MREGPPDLEALLARFLEQRNERTARAYAADLRAFAEFTGCEVPDAVRQLVCGDRAATERLVMDYAVDLSRRFARSTVHRRLATLGALGGEAHDAGIAAWPVAIPSWEEIAEAERTQPATDSEHYLLPRHPDEIDRLDIQHYAFRAVLGANYLAPVERPARVLDVGSGSGQWGFDVCRELPGAVVVGVDLIPSKPDEPAAYLFVRGNVLQGLPFADDQFDFTHQRLLMAGIPLVAWPALASELVRVTRPGGWVELTEGPWEFERAGPATRRLLSLVGEMLAARGLDTTRVIFDSLDGYLRDAGLTRVTRRELSLPIGEWGGQVGSLMATDLRAGWTRVCELLQAMQRLTADEARDLIQASLAECETGRMAGPSAIAYGQKPLS